MPKTVEPYVSIILPAYNAEDYLGEALASVLGQSYPHWELLVVNDGSQDGTAEILAAVRDPRVRVFFKKNGGVSSARNLGLNEMRGRYFTFLDSDDLLPTNSLEAQVSALESHPEIDLLVGSLERFQEQGRESINTWRPSFRGNPLRHFCRLHQDVFCSVAMMIRRYPRLRYRFREDMTHSEDLLFFIHLAAQKPGLYASIPDLVYRYRRRPGSAMSDLEGLEEGYRALYKEVCLLKNDEVRWEDRLYLKYRYVRIMALSYLRAGRYGKAVRMLQDLVR